MKKKLLAIILSILCYANSRGQALAYNDNAAPASHIQFTGYSTTGSSYGHPYVHTGPYIPALMIVGGLALAVVGGGLMLSNQDANSQVYQNGQGALVAGAISFSLGSLAGIIQSAATHRRRLGLTAYPKEPQSFVYRY